MRCATAWCGAGARKPARMRMPRSVSSSPIAGAGDPKAKPCASGTRRCMSASSSSARSTPSAMTHASMRAASSPSVWTTAALAPSVSTLAISPRSIFTKFGRSAVMRDSEP